MVERVTHLDARNRNINGRPTGAVFLELGPAGYAGFIKVEVFVDLEFPDHVTITVADVSAGLRADQVPRLRVRTGEVTLADLPIATGRV